MQYDKSNDGPASAPTATNTSDADDDDSATAATEPGFNGTSRKAFKVSCTIINGTFHDILF